MPSVSLFKLLLRFKNFSLVVEHRKLSSQGFLLLCFTDVDKRAETVEAAALTIYYVFISVSMLYLQNIALLKEQFNIFAKYAHSRVR